MEHDDQRGDAREAFAVLLDQATTHTEADCWICPATASVAPIGYENTGDSWLTSLWSLAGWPAISIPVYDGPGGLPRGLQCIARAGGDEQLLEWAGALATTLERKRAG
ncbi:amidase family protein [Actinopolymorpha sp. B17G11]|uniref:amidase family protein n=1 Tax=Actinopolymorpha sp. B17G11 TaxID=3160861 RepID=UPI0032E52612